MKPQDTSEARPDLYIAGGTLPQQASSYIERSADTQLLHALQEGQYCYVLTPRQMGKSSLMVRTAGRLKEHGISSVVIDLTQIGTKDIALEEWYLGQLHRVAKQLRLTTPYQTWWMQHAHLGPVQRFAAFLMEVMLPETTGDIVIFVDEIDSTLSLSFSDDYFAAIRSLYNERATLSESARLRFVLLGAASPSDLIKDPKRTPFNIGRRIQLSDFTPEEAQPLANGLAPDAWAAQYLFSRVYFWTGGHPYLTQKACRRIAAWAREAWNPEDVEVIAEELIHSLFFSESGRETDDNLNFIRDRVLETPNCAKLLKYYKGVRLGEMVADNDLDPLLSTLKLSGLVKASDGGVLTVRNPIYERVFDQAWIEQTLAERDPAGETEQESAYDVYVSYSRRDDEWVHTILVPRLQAAGLRVFVDYIGLKPGMNWEYAVSQALIRSRNMVLVLTPSSVVSTFILSEASRFLSASHGTETQRQLIPLLLKKCSVPELIARFQWIDFTSESRWSASMSELLRSLGASEAQRGSAIPLRPQTPRTPKRYDTGVVRKLLDAALDNDELTAFVYDYFRSVYERYDEDMPKARKIQVLIEYTERNYLVDDLLDHIAIANPRQYQRFRDQLSAL